MRRRRAAGAMLVAAVAVTAAGCGNVADQAPDQILLSAAQALHGIHSYRVAITSRQSGASVSFDVAVAQPGRFDGTLSSQGITAHIRSIDGKVYYRGRQFLAAFLPPALAGKVGDGWVSFPNQNGGLGSWSFLADVDHVADCLQFEHGTLTRGSASVVRGAKVITVKDKGDAPGAPAATYSVATGGTPWLVSIDVSAAPANPGELTCGPSGGGAGLSGTAMFSNFGQAYVITVPKGAVDGAAAGSG